MGGGGVFALFGFRRRQRRGHEAVGAEARQRRKGDGYGRPRQQAMTTSRSYEAEVEAWERKVRRTDEDHGRWDAGLDVDRQAKEFIDRVHGKLMNADHLMEAI
ncbi:hypothetical protein MUK42_08971 [Musa troglodytarum]|uniref:Uncharacterized protein n=1 Tax=Musa troglodytarum TaxID=320322 RepID=A0A9E7EES1_9LILI|nr:hypothetical protein MUK42_08971 [Musa troglodytarum]